MVLTQATPSSLGLFSSSTFNSASSSATQPTTTSSRSSRLRGLSYLRTYTQNHILSRDSSSNHHSSASGSSQRQPPAETPTLTRAATYSASTRRSGGRLASTSTIHDPLSSSDEAATTTTTTTTANGNSLALPQNPIRRITTAPGLTSTSPEAAAETTPSESSSNPTPDSDGERTTSSATKTTTDDQDTDETGMTRTRSATTGDLAPELLPTIRFTAYYDSRSNRQSLTFSPVARTLPTGAEIIKVGRYSERENHAPVPANAPSAAPVGFKSKVVSRRHCEFWHEKGKWYIKDVKSSSGTFLNHIRLSPPGTESKPFPINDGDIVQLGIDFRGGEEMIFRCVKMRIELNRGWQAKPNTFNMATHKRLRNMTSTASTASHAQDCSICLNAIAPCQSLFVAPCSHTWHFKCIRELLMGPSWPIFTCPNCRAAADLDADVDEPPEEWEQFDEDDDMSDDPSKEASPQPNGNLQVTPVTSQLPGQRLAPELVETESAGDVTVMLDSSAMDLHTPSRHTTSNPVSIPNATPRQAPIVDASGRTVRTPSPNGNPLIPPTEGPITPRNDAGPWVFDGDAGRASQEVTRRGGMTSLDAATTQVETNAA